MIRPFSILVFLAAAIAAVAETSGPWSVTATDTTGYVAPGFGNGHTGGVVGINGVSTDRLFQATVFDDGRDGQVSTIRPVIRPISLSITVDGRKGLSRWTQTLEFDHATIVTHYNIGDVEITTGLRALRQMPHALMAEVSLKAEKNVEVTIANRPEFPASLTDTALRNVTVWCEDGGLKLQRATATYSGGQNTLAASSMLVADRGNWTQISADSLTINLKKGEEASMWIIAAECSQADFADPVSESEREVIYAYRHGADRLRKDHNAAWKKLWQGDIRLQADNDLPFQVRSAIYNLYSSLRSGSRRSIAPMGLTSDAYYGHIFWDADTWIFPVMLVLQPELARSMIDYRIDGLPAARRKAAAYGYRGAMFPWEADHRGEESTPTFALTGPLEHHVTADVARAAWQYFCATADTAWLRTEAYPLLRDCADFWVSRAEPDPRGGMMIANVVGADEYAIGVDNDAFTNGAARRALEHADRAARVLGLTPDPRWAATAEGLRIETMPDDPTIIRQHRTYNGETTKQADVELLAYPLHLLTDPDQIKANINHYAQRIDSIGGPAMSHSAMAVNYARMGEPETSALLIDRALRPYLRGPFMQIAETPSNDRTYFMTGAGGLLQSILFGFAGFDITDNGIVQRPEGISLKGTGIKNIIVTTP